MHQAVLKKLGISRKASLLLSYRRFYANLLGACSSAKGKAKIAMAHGWPIFAVLYYLWLLCGFGAVQLHFRCRVICTI